MDERDISEVDVLRVMNAPDLTYPGYGERVSEDDRLLRMVFVDTPDGESDAKSISAIDLEEGGT
jgi:hypothetical protein